jgi:hypothetical protein
MILGHSVLATSSELRRLKAFFEITHCCRRSWRTGRPQLQTSRNYGRLSQVQALVWKNTEEAVFLKEDG